MITVPYVQEVQVQDQHSIDKALQSATTYHIGACDWPEDYPYCPDADFRMVHTSDCLIIKYDVTEEGAAAFVEEDMGEVWKDSCVEFFFQPEGSGKYYNLEATCVGRILLAHRSGRNDPTPAPQNVLKSILRFPSLGTGTFTERKEPLTWSLTLVIPATALFEDGITSFHGLKGRCNVYKCGDRTSKVHYLSFNPIDTPAPDFHRPEFFTEIIFE